MRTFGITDHISGGLVHLSDKFVVSLMKSLYPLSEHVLNIFCFGVFKPVFTHMYQPAPTLRLSYVGLAICWLQLKVKLFLRELFLKVGIRINTVTAAYNINRTTDEQKQMTYVLRSYTLTKQRGKITSYNFLDKRPRIALYFEVFEKETFAIGQVIRHGDHA